MIMNQKFIIRLGVVLALALGTVVSAEAKKTNANAYQDVNGPALTVSGVITDANGEPLPGASVMIKGSTTGTVTDLDGKYTLSAKQGQTLVVSYIGFKDQELTADKAVKNVALESDSTILDDAVVVGYGTTKKANLTGAVDQVGEEVFQDRPVANMQQMLKGAIPNLQADFSDGKPSRTTTFIIRGMGNIGNLNTTSDGNALVLIDGVEGDPELLNPNDIESVSVLKDAASAAIYGSRGPYGVILITTKDPSKNTDKVTVTYSANANWGSPTTIPDVITDGLQYAELAAQANYGWNDKYSLQNLGKSHYFYDKSGKAITIDKYVEQYRAFRQAGNKGSYDTASDGKYLYYGNEDWYSQLYKDSAFSQIHNLSVSGTAGKVSYMLSGRLYAYDGLFNYDPDTYKTNNLRAKISAPVFPWLKISENIEYTYDKLHQPVASGTAGTGSVFDATETFGSPTTYINTFAFPTIPVYNNDGSLTLAGAYVFGSMINKESYVDVIKTNFRTTTGLEASFFENHLRVKADYTYRSRYTDKTTKKTGVKYSDSFGEIKNILNETKLRQQFLSDAYTNVDYQAVNAYAEYENTWNKHYFKGMVGYNYEQNVQQSHKIAKRGLLDTAESSYAFCQGEWVDNAFDGNVYKFNTGYKKRRLSGVFYRFNYNFDERYLIEIDGRYDGSSIFPVGRQWHFFPSVSAGWRVSQEPWWHVNPKAMSNLKVRASYGSAGDTASMGPYNFQETYEIASYSGTRVINGSTTAPYFKYPNSTNSSYSWATVTTMDFGLDLGFLNGKINITGDYYIRRTTDMLVDSSVYPATFGSEAPKDNCAAMSTYGWEIVASYNDAWMVGGKPFNFGFKFTIGDNTTWVDSYKNDSGSIDEWAFRAGQQAGEIWGYRSNGLFQTQEQINTAFNGKPYVNTLIKTNNAGQIRTGDIWLLDLNGNGKIDKGDNTASNPGDREIIGNVCARYMYGFNIDLGWNGIFLSAIFNGVGKQDWSPAGKNLVYGLYGNNSRQMLKWTANNMWSEDNPNALFPRLSAANKYFDGSYNHWSCYMNKYPVDRYIFNIAYLRLQNLQVGYNLPKNLVKKISLSGVKVYLSAENLFTWSPFYKYTKDFDVLTINSHGDDPGNGISWSSSSIGQQYPVLKTFSVGLTITY